MSSLTITLIQPRLHWEDKAANLAMLEQQIAAAGPTELVVLPEMFSTGFSMKAAALAEPMDGPVVQWMQRQAQQHHIILTGSVIIEAAGHFFNRLIWMQPNGQYGYYDKRHLFAFAGEDKQYTPGNKRLITSVKGWRIHVQICYDLRFPVWARQQPGGEQPEYDLLLYVANWPERRSLAWKTLLQARAIENQCYVAGVNRVGPDGNDINHSGDSMLIDPLGEVLYHQAATADIFTTTLHKAPLTAIRNQFPFWKDGDGFVIV